MAFTAAKCQVPTMLCSDCSDRLKNLENQRIWRYKGWNSLNRGQFDASCNGFFKKRRFACMVQRLDELLQSCTVKITVPGQVGWGTGFFVAPGLVLTCAHVVKALKPEAAAQISWQREESAEGAIAQLIPAFDLALLRVVLPEDTKLPCVYLDGEFQPTDNFYTYGYPDSFPDGASVTSQCEGDAHENGVPLILFKSGLIRPGFSGSPLLNLRTGKVCGIVKFTRDRSIDLGGGAIPTRTILQQFSGLREQQQQFHQVDRRWSKLVQLQGIPNNLPRTSVAQFVGRDAALSELHQQLQQNEPTVITAIAGMGGVGKSELALQYANNHLKQQTYPGGVCWLEVQELDVGTKLVQLATSWFNLMPPDSLDLSGQVDFCWQHWAAGDVLIIFDGLNTATDYERVVPYLPPADARFKVLLTTRERIGAPVSRLDLNALTPRAALKLLESLIGRERLRQEPWIARQLYKRLGYLPLGLELVGRYLAQEEDLTLAKMKSQLEAEGLTQEAFIERDPRMTAKRGAEAAFELSWKTLTLEAQQLSYLLSLFAPVTIPWSLVERCLEKSQQQTLGKARRTLLTLSLLERQGEGYYRLHPLIRDFFGIKRQRQEQFDKPQIDQLKQQFCQGMVAIAQEISETPTREYISTVTAAIPHIVAAATTWKDALSDDNLILPYIGLERFYQGQGLFAQAESWFIQCLNHSRERLGEEHPDVATSLNNLALFHHYQGHYEEAESLYMQALDLRQQLLGTDHIEVATSLNNLAGIYELQGRYTKAESLYLQSLSIRREQLGVNHPDVAGSLNNLAGVYELQGRYAKAEPLYLKALELRRSQLGDRHPDVAQSLNNLGYLYIKKQHYAKAEPLYLKALELRKSQLGDRHPDVAQSLNNLAYLYNLQKRYSTAEPYYLQALEILSEKMGENHPDVASIHNNLGNLYANQGCYSKSELRYQTALEILNKELDENHPNIFNIRNKLKMVRGYL